MTEQNATYLSVIVCTRDRPNEAKACLKALCLQAIQYYDVEIIVVDNSSTRSALPLFRDADVGEMRCARYVHESRPGLCVARNKGRLEATGEVLAYIDDDAIPHPNWISEIRDHFARQISDCIAGRIEATPVGGIPSWLPKEMFGLLGATHYGPDCRELRPFELPTGANFAIRKYVFDAIGGFNSEIALYGDETEFFRRVANSPFTLFYQPRVAVDHCMIAERVTKRALLGKAFDMGRGAGTIAHIEARGKADELTTVAKYVLRTIYIACRLCTGPTYGRWHTLYFNCGVLRQLIVRGH